MRDWPPLGLPRPAVGLKSFKMRQRLSAKGHTLSMNSFHRRTRAVPPSHGFVITRIQSNEIQMGAGKVEKVHQSNAFSENANWIDPSH
jgi:hypothetical protein